MLCREANHTMRLAYYAFLRPRLLSVDQLLVLDEMSADNNVTLRRYGYADRRQRAFTNRKYGIRGTRLSFVGALSVTGMDTFAIFEGAMCRKDFIEFLLYRVLPLTTPFPGPRSILILDNASIHKGSVIRAICAMCGVILAYLPPYSPDLSPIGTVRRCVC